MRLNGGGKGIPSDILGQIRTRGNPLVARVDEIVGSDRLRVTPLVPIPGYKTDKSVLIRMAPSKARTRTISEAIAGTDKLAKIVPADIVAFENAFEYDGELLVEQISARTNDVMRGKVQVVTAMARPSKSLVNAKGALQSLTITDGKNGRSAKSIAKVRDVFAWVKAQAWPGGAPGMLIRDQQGYVKEFFEEGRSNIETLVEDMEHEEVFATAEDIVELIPAWRLPMGRDQVVRDVDPRTETAAQAGQFTRRFITPESRGYPGFLPCLVIIADEEQWEFGGKTGKVIRVAAGVQPLDKFPAIARERLPSAVRTYKGTANGINTLYDDATILAMSKERAERSPRAEIAPRQERSDGNRHEEQDAGGPRTERKAGRPFSLNGGGGRPPSRTEPQQPTPAQSSGPRRFGR